MLDPFGFTRLMVPRLLLLGSALHCSFGVTVPDAVKLSVPAWLPRSWVPEPVKICTWLPLPCTTRTSISLDSWSMAWSRWSSSAAVALSFELVVASCWLMLAICCSAVLACWTSVAIPWSACVRSDWMLAVALLSCWASVWAALIVAPSAEVELGVVASACTAEVRLLNTESSVVPDPGWP
jgi:hypothetical protein